MGVSGVIEGGGGFEVVWTDLRRDCAVVDEVLGQDLHDLVLLVVRQARDGGLDDAADGGVVRGDEAAVVEEGDRAHDELAVEAVRHAAVAGDGVAKVLDLECALEAGGEEAAKGRDERGKGGQDDHVELHGHDVEGVRDGKVRRDAVGDEGDGVGLGGEDGVWLALEAGEDVCAQVVDGADEELVLGEEVGRQDAPDDGEEPGAEEALPRLLGGDLDQLVAAKGDAAEVGEDVVCYDHGYGQDEPDEALEDVVDDKVGLADDEEEGHVRPGKLGELELVVTLLQREDEEDEAWTCQQAQMV